MSWLRLDSARIAALVLGKPKIDSSGERGVLNRGRQAQI